MAKAKAQEPVDVQSPWAHQYEQEEELDKQRDTAAANMGAWSRGSESFEGEHVLDRASRENTFAANMFDQASRIADEMCAVRNSFDKKPGEFVKWLEKKSGVLGWGKTVAYRYLKIFDHKQVIAGAIEEGLKVEGAELCWSLEKWGRGKRGEWKGEIWMGGDEKGSSAEPTPRRPKNLTDIKRTFRDAGYAVFEIHPGEPAIAPMSATDDRIKSPMLAVTHESGDRLVFVKNPSGKGEHVNHRELTTEEGNLQKCVERDYPVVCSEQDVHDLIALWA